MQYVIAFLEGIITFISPCLLPMLPIYISYFAGGGDGNPEDAYKAACSLLHHINIAEICPLVGSFNTNKLSAIKDNNAIKEITDIANYLNN